MEESDLDVAQVELTHDEGKMIIGVLLFCITVVGGFSYAVLASMGFMS